MFYDILTLGLDVLLCGFLYNLYQKRQNKLEETKKAPIYKIDSNLPQTISNYEGQIIPYAIVRGTVKAAGKALHSQHNPEITGVIQKIIIKEHKSKWNSVSELWRDVESVIRKSINSVPFHLTDGSWWKTRVEVLGAEEAERLPLTVIYDHFTPTSDSIGGVILSWMSGEKSRGLQEIEEMLTEGTELTAFGEIVMDSTGMKIRVPKNGMSYILTTFSPEEVFEKMESENHMVKNCAIFVGVIGIFLAYWYTAKWLRNWKQDREKREIQRQRDEARRRRLQAEQTSRARGEEPSTLPRCVICMEQPIEIVVLDCGHACMCIDCGSQVRNTCPMCRAPITRTVIAYLP